MPDDAINLYADEPLEVQFAGVLGRMIKAGRLEHTDPVPPQSSPAQGYGVSSDTAPAGNRPVRDECAVFTMPSAEPASAPSLGDNVAEARAGRSGPPAVG
jgi:hypothetical protein